MRDWSLGPGDPLFLTLSADFRFCDPDYINDQAWELELGGGEPAALALRTTYGLRARSMRIFPRFTVGSQSVSAPSAFVRPPRLRRFFPNFLLLDFSPLPLLDVTAEYWVPDSHTCAGRLALTNTGKEPLALTLELCAQLVPFEDGAPMAPLPMQLATVLAGQTSDLAPVLFMTGGPQPGAGPMPSLSLALSLNPAETRTLTWCQAALGSSRESLDQARLAATRPWEAERARIEMVNAAATLEIHTGDPEWDAAFALSQKAGLGFFFSASEKLPCPTFVSSRGPDSGFSRTGDGSDHSAAWSGQSPLEAWYLAGLLPAAPEIGAGLLRNFLHCQEESGLVPWKTGLSGLVGRWTAAPILASLAWQVYQRSRDLEFLRELEPGLNTFLLGWLAAAHDRDGDGFPEWDHPLQSGFEDNPAFAAWRPGDMGLELTAVESPSLAALLCQDLHSLALINEVLGQREQRDRLELQAAQLHRLVEACWDPRASLYRNRDRDSHLSQAGKVLGSWRGAGTLLLNQEYPSPLRLLVRLELKGGTTMRPEVILKGRSGEAPVVERLERMDFKWGSGFATTTSRNLFTSLESVQVAGLEKRDKLYVCAADLAGVDITLLMPLYAGIPASERALEFCRQTVFGPEKFGRPFGLPACPVPPSMPGLKTTPDGSDGQNSANQAVLLPWNALVGQGLLTYGYRTEAAQLCGALMGAVIRNLKLQRAFYSAYHAVSAAGIGERNALPGLAPLGFFLDTLGLRIESPRRLVLSGKNPFPWPVTVKYKGLSVTRASNQTVVDFPDGRTITLHDPTDAVVSVD